MVRAAVACAWFGIQTWIGGEGIFLLAGKLIGNGWLTASHVGGYPWTQWLSFLVFWLIQMAIIARGMETLRRFENWAAPFVIVGAIALLVWISVKAGGFGPLLDQPSKLGWGSGFWKVFFPALMGMIGFWSTLSLNIPDFTRFGGSQKAQIRGQALGLPTTMTFFALLSVLVTSGSQAVYGTPIWDPIALAAKMDSTAGILFALLTVMIATLSVNIAANVVSPAYDLSNLLPKWVTFRTGALITGVVGIVIFPWKLISDPQIYIFTWLGVVGGLLGTVAGILIADYWIVRRSTLDLADLYRPGGRYWYVGGWNWRAVTAFAVGGLLAVGGSYGGPFPTDGLIPSSSRSPTTAGRWGWRRRWRSTSPSVREAAAPPRDLGAGLPSHLVAPLPDVRTGAARLGRGASPAGRDAYTSMWEPMMIVRSRGRPKYSAASAVM
ncbi:hypothetical protein GCM10025734_14110 [Kitasatospora paranensis]